MTQLSFELKFPWEAEQISLDLDFKPCEKYQRDLWLKRNAEGEYTTLSYNGMGGITLSQGDITSSVNFMPHSTSVGYWKLGESYQIHNRTRPKWLHQKMAKIFFGMTWVDK